MFVYLHEPIKGYTSGELTGEFQNFRHEVRLASGSTVWLYEDEFTKTDHLQL